MVGAIGQWSAACRSLATKFEVNPGSVGCCRGRGPYAFSGPDKRLSVKVTTCNIPVFRNPAVILIDQLRAIYIDGELDAIETANWLPKLVRKDYAVGLSIIGNGVDDPDQNFYERYACGAAGNFTGYCNPELDKMIAAQSGAAAAARVRLIVWCRDCRHQIEPDPAAMAERYGAELSVPDWHQRLVCGQCGSRKIDFVVTGAKP